ncbi:uncharacterized protein LOC105421115 [Amborella trichopoda]|uniref:uncharacterized protein LOC105421115 n=1 Tax=Amborella trichopoda TaxID=13333 RepID=UPI0005D38C5F|nr:uncharacterized protein LOC105421115 [Amborella trichopoda]|eukprot:XP_011625619.1 uncharacterized protein LOC105421115 [Amborella trichopoda]
MTRLTNGQVQVDFLPSSQENQTRDIFPTHFQGMLEKVPILAFNKLGQPVYEQKTINGHNWFDYCNCDFCLQTDDEMEIKKKKAPKKKSSSQSLHQRYQDGDPTVDLLGESSDSFSPLRDSEKIQENEKHLPEPEPLGDMSTFLKTLTKPSEINLHSETQSSSDSLSETSTPTTLSETSDLLYMMNQPEADPPEEPMEPDLDPIPTEEFKLPNIPLPTYGDSSKGFTIDDIPPSKWIDRFKEIQG